MSDPKKTVQEYLFSNGYPFEMFVAKAFKKAGFEVYQSSIYTDPETGKHREIDITAYFSRFTNNIHYNFKVIIECKYAKHIWILFSGENEGFNSLNIDNYYCSNYAGNKLLSLLSNEEDIHNQNLFKIDQKIGYGLTEATTKEDKNEGRTTYKAITTIINSLLYEQTIEKNEKGKTFSIFIPIIAIHGKLFETYLDDSDGEVINEINEGQLIYKSNIYPNVFPIIELITKDKTEALALKLFSDFERILKKLEGELKSLTLNFPSPSEKLKAQAGYFR